MQEGDKTRVRKIMQGQGGIALGLERLERDEAKARREDLGFEGRKELG